MDTKEQAETEQILNRVFGDNQDEETSDGINQSADWRSCHCALCYCEEPWSNADSEMSMDNQFNNLIQCLLPFGKDC